MNKINALAIASLIILASPGQAEAKGWFEWLSPSPSPRSDFQIPYTYDAKTPHVESWNDPQFDVQSWTGARGSKITMMNDLYASGIIKDQTADDGVPVLKVGPTFMTLSNPDRLKVAKYVDSIYGVTAQENGTILLENAETEKQIGIYTRHGLQLQ